jgi:exonuclease III
MAENLKIVIWNVCGLNARARRLAIRSLMETSDASIICFQETKMDLISSYIVCETLGSEFDEFVYLPADGTRGGVLLAWKSRMVSVTNPMLTTNAITAKVVVSNSVPWWISVVYGPQEDADKIAFL